jgi:hypothetical protein
MRTKTNTGGATDAWCARRTLRSQLLDLGTECPNATESGYSAFFNGLPGHQLYLVKMARSCVSFSWLLCSGLRMASSARQMSIS